MKPPNFLQSPAAFCECYLDHLDRLREVQAFVQAELVRFFSGIVFSEKDQNELAEGLLMLIEQNTGEIRQAVEQLIHWRCDPIVQQQKKQLAEPEELPTRVLHERKPRKRSRARQFL